MTNRCSACRSVAVVPGRYFDVVTIYSAELPCLCSATKNAIAARRRYQQTIRFQEWGPPGQSVEEHHDCREELERYETGEIAFEVECPNCVSIAEAGAWTEKVESQVQIPNSECRFLQCLRCGTETTPES